MLNPQEDKENKEEKYKEIVKRSNKRTGTRSISQWLRKIKTAICIARLKDKCLLEINKSKSNKYSK
jgi:hypothetical protein